MQVKLIHKYIKGFKDYLPTNKAQQFHYVWESQGLFQKNWDMDEDDFGLTYDKSLQNSKTRRLWSQADYAPKAMMLKFLDLQPDYVQQMFRDLYNEEKEVEGRVSRFVFYCDQLLAAYKEAHPHSIENNHFHDDDYWMVSVYLSFRYPEKYTLYNKDAFIKLLQRIGAKNIPQANDFGRFVKVTKTLNTFLRKDEALLESHQARFADAPFFDSQSLLLVYDFYHFVAEEK